MKSGAVTMARESKPKLDQRNDDQVDGERADRAGRSAPAIGDAYGPGGSARAGGAPWWGGGYLETCSDSEVAGSGSGAGRAGDSERVADPIAELGAGDPRVERLRDCGLNPLWVRMAEIAGFERFVAMWSMLDQAEPVLDDRRRLYVPCIEKTLLRYQRDEIISALARAGMGPAEIQRILSPFKDSAKISLRTIERIHARAVHSHEEKANERGSG